MTVVTVALTGREIGRSRNLRAVLYRANKYGVVAIKFLPREGDGLKVETTYDDESVSYYEFADTLRCVAWHKRRWLALTDKAAIELLKLL